MQQFSFYQTTEELFHKSICQIVEKCYSAKLYGVVLAGSLEQQELLNKLLWTYSRGQFIPHGSKLDALPEKQPIYITDEYQNPNQSSILVLIEPFDIEALFQNKKYLSHFSRIIIIYNSEIQLNQLALLINTNIAEASIDCYKQSPNGSWAKINSL